MLLSDLAQRSELRPSGISEHNIELALLALDLREEPIKIAKVRRVSLYAGHIFSDLLYAAANFRLTAPGYEDVRAFVHKLLRRRQAMPLLPPVISAIFPSAYPYISP